MLPVDRRYYTAHFLAGYIGLAMHASVSFAESEGLAPLMRPPLGLRGELLAQASPSPGDAEPAGAAAGGGLRAPADAQPAGDFDRPWGIPPIRWGGTMTTEARAHKVGDQSPRFQLLEYSTIRGASYIYQPWFAQIGASLGLLTARERGGGGGGPNDRSLDSSSAAITGGGTLALFPVSRFPFNAYYERSDTRANGELVQNDTVNTRFGARQSYTAADAQSSYSGTFDRSTLTSPSFGRDTVNALALNANRLYGSHVFDLAGGYTNNRRSNTGESTQLKRLYGRHRYSPDPNLSVETLASYTASDFHLVSAGTSHDNRANFTQASTFGTWRPDDDSPLLVTGGGRFFQSTTQNNGVGSDARTLTGNAAATYALTRNTTIGASGLVTQVDAGGTNDLLTAQTGSITHIGDPSQVGGFIYTWNASANAANQTSTLHGGRRNVGGQLGHNLTRDFAVTQASALTFAAGQSVSNTYDTVTARSTTLSHNASLTWRLVPTANTTGFLSVLGADSRTYGHNANRFQLFNAQATGQVQLNRYSFAAANLTAQAVQQTTPESPPSGFDWVLNGSVSYQHVRAFAVPRLRYFAQYNINDTQYSTRLQGDVNATREQVSQSFEQRFDYNIGRIEIRLSTRLAVIDGKRNGLVFLRVARQFGQF